MASRPEREKQTEWNSTGTGGWTPRPPEPPAAYGTYLHPPRRAPRPPAPAAPSRLRGRACGNRAAVPAPLCFLFLEAGREAGRGLASVALPVGAARRTAPAEAPGPQPAGTRRLPRATPRVTPCPYVMGLGGEHPKVGFLPHRPRLGAWHPHRCLPPTPAAVAPGPYLGARCGGYGRSRGCATRLDHFMGRRGPAGGGARSGPPRAAPTRGPPGRDVPWDAGSSGHGSQPLGRLAAEARGPSRAAPHAAPPAVTLFASVIFSLPAAGGFGSRPALPRGAVCSTTSPGSPGTG